MNKYRYCPDSPLGISGAFLRVEKDYKKVGYICRYDQDKVVFLEQTGLYPTGVKIQQTNLDALKAEIENYFK